MRVPSFPKMGAPAKKPDVRIAGHLRIVLEADVCGRIFYDERVHIAERLFAEGSPDCWLMEAKGARGTVPPLLLVEQHDHAYGRPAYGRGQSRNLIEL